jgi:hypothetical protein
MMLDEQQLQKLLRIKRFEQPPPGYFDRALIEFHRRQREELLRRSATSIWWERLVSGLWNFRVPSYAYGAAFGMFVVAATIVGSGLWTPSKDATDLNPGSVAVISGPAAQETSGSWLALNGNLDWSKFDHMASSPKVVPVIGPSQTALPRYVLDGRPVSYKASFSF